jgi:hypothetical protein
MAVEVHVPYMQWQLENCRITSYSISGASTLMVGQTFVGDPVGSLRRQGFVVPPATEPAWRQFANALQALQRATAPAQTGAKAPYLEICIPVR